MAPWIVMDFDMVCFNVRDTNDSCKMFIDFNRCLEMIGRFLGRLPYDFPEMLMMVPMDRHAHN